MDHFTTLSMVLYDFLRDTTLPNTVELMGIYGRVSVWNLKIIHISIIIINEIYYYII